MPSAESFEIDVDGGTVRGALYRPNNVAAGAALPAVLICRGVQVPGEDADGLLDDLSNSLCAAGVAAARFEPRCADLILEDFDAHNATHDVEDAVAAFHWLAERGDIHSDCIGVIGYSMGAIAAAALAQKSQQIARLCLLAAATAGQISACLHNGETGGGPMMINVDHLPASYLPSLSGIDSPRDAAFHARPTLIIHGAADRFVPPEGSVQFLAALEAAGRPVEHVLVARASHTFASPETRAACLDQTCRFFAAMAAQRAAVTEPAKSSA